MRRRHAFALVVPLLGLAVLAGVLLFRPEPEIPPVPEFPRLPLLRAAPTPPEPRPLVIERPPLDPPPDPARLIPFLRALGRAAMLNDRRGWRAALEQAPTVHQTDVQALLRMLQSSDLSIAIGAAEQIGIYRIEAGIEPLVARLASKPPVPLRLALVRALERLDAEERLAQWLNHEPDAMVREQIVRALAGEDGVLAGVLQRDPDRRVRSAAAFGMEDPWILIAALSREQDLSVAEAIFISAYRVPAARADLRRLLGAIPRLGTRMARRARSDGPLRYRRLYPEDFFEEGGAPVRFNAHAHARIGLTIDLSDAPADRTLQDVADRIFTRSPWDRYVGFFYLRRAAEFNRDLETGAASPRAYDAAGERIEGGLPLSPLDGVAFIRFADRSDLPEGILGFTSGPVSIVTDGSMLHELGHAFAGLGDEYSDARATDEDTVNVELRTVSLPDWQGLIDQEHLPDERIPRIEPDEFGDDAGIYIIPAHYCTMNSATFAGRFCPVCQLEIVARISKLSGVNVPW